MQLKISRLWNVSQVISVSDSLIFEFKVNFDLEDQGQLTSKLIGILTKVFCIFSKFRGIN